MRNRLLFILSFYGGRMKIDKYIPKMYKKNIFDIDYDMLKKRRIKCIIFDLDNTILVFGEKKISSETKDLFNRLKKDFKLIVMSNNFKRKISRICKELEVDFISFALKPLKIGFNKIQKRYNYSKNEMCVVGDQLITDILGGNNFGILSILVEPISKRDLKVTKINRILERKIFNILEEEGILERGKYYES